MSYKRHIALQNKRNKQTYLTANSQFLVLTGYDASIHKADPDWPVDWDSIEEVRFKQTLVDKHLTCPVCLDGPPVAAKITRCGHIYCWSCILRYLSLTDDNLNHKPCPICFEPVYKNDLRSVLFHTFVNYSVGDQIDLQLMVRHDGCVEVSPFKDEFSPATCDSNCNISTATAKSSLVPAASLSTFQVFGNLIVANAEAVLQSTIVRERSELIARLETLADDEPEVFFIRQAINYLTKRVERLQEKQMFELQCELSAVSSLSPSSSYASKQPTDSHSVNTRPSKEYLFYQSVDGQHIYLNPFCTRILKHDFKRLENAPQKLCAKILQSDHISMNNQYRKRFKHLAHLPISCEFQLVELDFERFDLVSRDTFKVFEQEIIKRDHERRRRKREEKKRDKIWQEEQKRRIYGVHGYTLPPSSKIDLNNPEQFPSVSDERFAPAAGNKALVTQRAHSYFNDDNDDFDQWLSTDDEAVVASVDVNDNAAVTTTSLAAETTANIVPSEPQPGPTVDASSPLLSFADIQLEQQAAAVVESAAKSKVPWNAKSAPFDSSSNQRQNLQSASFAQLLVNAKSSPKVWTRANPRPNPNQAATTAGCLTERPRPVSDNSDDDGEELRAPRVEEFCLADFIVKTAPLSKRRARKQLAAKKG